MDDRIFIRASIDCPICRGSGVVVDNGAPHGEGFWPMESWCDCAFEGPDVEGLTDDDLECCEVIPAEGYYEPDYGNVGGDA